MKFSLFEMCPPASRRLPVSPADLRPVACSLIPCSARAVPVSSSTRTRLLSLYSHSPFRPSNSFMRSFCKTSFGPLAVPCLAKVSTLLSSTVYVTGESGNILT
jgi:hypothetical protein